MKYNRVIISRDRSAPAELWCIQIFGVVSAKDKSWFVRTYVKRGYCTRQIDKHHYRSIPIHYCVDYFYFATQEDALAFKLRWGTA